MHKRSYELRVRNTDAGFVCIRRAGPREIAPAYVKEHLAGLNCHGQFAAGASGRYVHAGYLFEGRVFKKKKKEKGVRSPRCNSIAGKTRRSSFGMFCSPVIWKNNVFNHLKKKKKRSDV